MSRRKPLAEEVDASARQDLHVAQLNRTIRGLRQELHEAQALREHVFGLTKPALEVPKWVSRGTPAKASEHIPVLLGSDYQWGEVIRAGNMYGVNEYNVKVAQERFRRLIERTINISREHLPLNRYPGIVYLRGGDMVSGDIHADLRESNELAAVPATRSLAEAETWGINELAEAFGAVHVVSVPGNHGRTTLKPQSKRGASDNYDTVSTWLLESAFRKDKRIAFYTPESGDALVMLYGRRYLLTHGDKMGTSGGKGFIGAAAPIVRGMKALHNQYASYGTPIAGCFIGHFHVALDVGYGWANGSLPGYSEFAKDNRMQPEEPRQWLIFFHAKYGPTSQWKVRVAPAPTIADAEHIRPFEVA
jgi:hypothetical protein